MKEELTKIITKEKCPYCDEFLTFIEPKDYDYSKNTNPNFLDFLFCENCKLNLHFQDAFLFFSEQFTTTKKLKNSNS